MELIENLLQLLITFVGALLSGHILPEKPTTGVFPAAVLLRLLCPRRALLDAVSAAVRYHTAGLLCVGVRLGGKPHLSCAFCRPLWREQMSEASAAAGRGSRLRSACRCWRSTALSGTFSQPDLVRHDDMALLLRHSGACLCRTQTGAARNMRYFHIGVLCFAFAEYLLWTAGCFWPDTSPASPTFWCDMLLTLAILGLLPAMRKAVDA